MPARRCRTPSTCNVSISAQGDVTLDELPRKSEAAGVGALLMTDPVLPRDSFSHPYQPLFWFDQHSRPLGLVLDVDGHVVAWENNADGNPDLSDDRRCQRVPPEVEQAAREWWSEQPLVGPG